MLCFKLLRKSNGIFKKYSNIWTTFLEETISFTNVDTKKYNDANYKKTTFQKIIQ